MRQCDRTLGMLRFELARQGVGVAGKVTGEHGGGEWFAPPGHPSALGPHPRSLSWTPEIFSVRILCAKYCPR
jgi:hypothetical protein